MPDSPILFHSFLKGVPMLTPVLNCVPSFAEQLLAESRQRFEVYREAAEVRETELIRENAGLRADLTWLEARLKAAEAELDKLRPDARNWQDFMDSIRSDADDMASRLRVTTEDYDAVSGRKAACLDQDVVDVTITEYISRVIKTSVEVDGETVTLRFDLRNTELVYDVSVVE
jgi:predicted nuclease with TOPRIM domain